MDACDREQGYITTSTPSSYHPPSHPSCAIHYYDVDFLTTGVQAVGAPSNLQMRRHYVPGGIRATPHRQVRQGIRWR